MGLVNLERMESNTCCLTIGCNRRGIRAVEDSEAMLIFAGLSVADLFLYWSQIGPILDGSE